MVQPLSRGTDNFASFSAGLFDPSAQALTYILANLEPNGLHEALTRALCTVPLSLSQRHIDNILAAFQAAGVPGAAIAQRAVEATNLRHCARCHESYYERHNGLIACVIHHINTPSVVCCREPIGCHFVGRHTTMTESVVYDSAVQRCNPNSRNCPMAPTELSGDSSTGSSTPDCSTSELGERLDADMEDTPTEAADSDEERAGFEADSEFDAQFDSCLPGR